MLNLLGEYDCKLDSKGRMLFPAGLRKQLQEVVHEGFVINRDLFDKCLVLYPMPEWEKVSNQVNRLNRFVAKNVRFIRKFNNGATKVELDSAGRMLIPSALAKYANLEKELKLTGNGDRIEIWSASEHQGMLDEDVDMASLAEDVMGDIDPDNNDE